MLLNQLALESQTHQISSQTPLARRLFMKPLQTILKRMDSKYLSMPNLKNKN
jgi:hypothetical protein